MARIEEATLFRPDSKLQYPGGNASGGGKGGGGSGDDEDGPSIDVRERISEAMRSAKRRKALSFVVLMIFGALTVLAAIFAPRTYEVESRVLVQRTNQFNGQNQTYVSPEEMRNIAKEYEEQMTARDNIIAIVRQKNLVERWMKCASRIAASSTRSTRSSVRRLRPTKTSSTRSSGTSRLA